MGLNPIEDLMCFFLLFLSTRLLWLSQQNLLDIFLLNTSFGVRIKQSWHKSRQTWTSVPLILKIFKSINLVIDLLLEWLTLYNLPCGGLKDCSLWVWIPFELEFSIENNMFSFAKHVAGWPVFTYKPILFPNLARQLLDGCKSPQTLPVDPAAHRSVEHLHQ